MASRSVADHPTRHSFGDGRSGATLEHCFAVLRADRDETVSVPRLPLAEVLARTEQIARDIAGPEAARIDAEGVWPERAVRALQAAGLGGLVVPEALGGLGHGMLALARVCEVLGSRCASTALCFGMHCVGAAVISAKATEDQRRRYLDPICEGRHLTTLALSEPGTGSHFYLPQAKLEWDGQRYRVNGKKSFVTNGGRADSYVVSAAASNPHAGPGDFSCVVLPSDAPGVEWQEAWSGVGMRGNSARTVELRDVLLPREDLLGQEGDEIWYVFNVVAPYFLIAMSGTYLGIAASALDEAREHLVSRKHLHSAQTLSQQPVIQHRVGELWATVERSRLLIYGAAERGDLGDPMSLPFLCSAKAEIGDAAVLVVNEALTLVGGKGYSESASPLFRHLRDARAAHVMAPTTDLLRVWTGRVVLGYPLLGD